MDSKQKEVYVDIIKDKQRSRLIVFGMIGLSAFVVLASLIFSFVIYRQSTKTLYAVDDLGNVARMVKEQAQGRVEDEMKFHLQYWFSKYYTYSFNNMQAQREDALWIIDEADAVKLEQKWQPWFEDVQLQSLDQQTIFIPGSLTIEQVADKEYQLQAEAQLTVTNAGFQNTYQLKIRSSARRIARSFPDNPHGFLFYNYSDDLTALVKNKPVK